MTDSGQEGKTGEIVLQAADPDSDDPQDACDDPEAVRQMVKYIYKQRYEDKQTLMMHAKIFALAVKYQIPGLRKLATNKFNFICGLDVHDEELFRATHYVYHSTPKTSGNSGTWSRPKSLLATRDSERHLKANRIYAASLALRLTYSSSRLSNRWTRRSFVFAVIRIISLLQINSYVPVALASGRAAKLATY